MMKREARMISQATGEEVPDWLVLDDDTVVEGVGDLVVREEGDGTWSIVRQVDGTMPEVDSGHATQETAMRLARAYSEGGRILVERRVSKEIVASGTRKGMVAEHGGSPVVITGVDGNDIQILSPDGEDKYVDISELTEIREAQELGLEPVPFFGGAPPAESPSGMMAGEGEEEEKDLVEELAEEELVEEEELEEEVEEEELIGLMVGPPVYFVEIEPTPGLRQSPLGASKTAAVYISQEKGERPDLRIKPSEMLDLYASIGIPLVKEAHHVKIGEVFLVFDESSGTFRLEDEIVNGSTTPMTTGMTEVEAPGVLQNHTDLSDAEVTAVLADAKKKGSISLGDRLGYLVKADVFLEPVEGEEGLMVLMEDGMAITDPMGASDARRTLMNSTSLAPENIQKAVEMALQGHTPRVANIKIAKEPPICKKCNQRHWPFQPCPGTKPEKEKSPEKAEEKAEGKEAKRVTAQPPGFPPFGETDWGGVYTDPTYVDPFAEPDIQPDPFASSYLHADPSGGTPRRVVQQSDGSYAFEDTSEPAPSPLEYSNMQRESPEGMMAGGSEEGTEEPAPAPERSDLLVPASKTAGRVHMNFDWDEFYSSVIPQLSNGQFQNAFAEIASSPPEAIAAQKEKDLYDEELLLLGRESSRRKLPDLSKLRFGIGSIAALVNEPDVNGRVVEYKGTANDVSYLLDMPTGHQVWFKDAELKPTSNPDTTTVPWTERTKRIVDPENKKQDSEFKQDLNRKVGQAEGEYIYTDGDLEDAAIAAVEGTIAKELVAAAAESVDSDRDPFDVAYSLVQEHKEALLALGRQLLPSMAVESPDEEAFMHYARNVVTWDLPKPSDAYYAEAMAAGASARLRADYATDNTELQHLRDLGIVGKIVELREKDAAIAFGDNILLIGQSGLEVVGNFFRECTIRKCQTGDKDPNRPADEQVWCLYAKSTGKVLGRHSSREKALDQEKAIKAQGAVEKLAPGAPSRGRGEGVGGPPQGDRGAEVCVCPITGKEYPKERGVPCSQMESPGNPGVKMVGKTKAEQIPPAPSRATQQRASGSKESARGVLAVKFLCEYANGIIHRVQSGVLTAADALKEINVTAKEWDWSAKEKKYVKQRLEGKDPMLPGTWAVAAARPFDSGRAPAQDSISGGGVKARGVRTAQSDIATLLKDLGRGEAQSIIRSLDASMDVSNALEGLGWGDDTTDLRQWLIDSPGMTEDILRMYAGDPEPANRLVSLRAMSERFPQADISAWLQDDFPFIAEKAQELASGAPAAEVLPPPVPTQVPQIPPVPESVPQVGAAKKHATGPPGSSPPSFPKNPEQLTDAKDKESVRRRTSATAMPIQLMLTHDTPNDQYVLYNMDFGLVSPSGANEKQIKGQLKTYGLDDARISEALKESKDSIVHIVALKRVAQQGVEQYIEDAVQGAIQELSPAAPRANITMTAMDKFAALTADLGLDPRQYHDALKSAIDAELENYPRPEIPGTKQEFTQIAEITTGRVYDEREKKRRIDDLAKHGIPLRETFEKKPPEDIPPGRRLSTGEFRNGFTTGDKVRDLAVPELTGVVAGFGAGETIRVAMDVSSYCPEGGVGLYLPDGLLNLEQSRYAEG